MKQIFSLGGATTTYPAASQGVLSLESVALFRDWGDDGMRRSIIPASGTFYNGAYNVETAPGVSKNTNIQAALDSTPVAVDDVDIDGASTSGYEPYSFYASAGQLVSFSGFVDSGVSVGSTSWSTGWEGDTSGLAICGGILVRPLTELIGATVGTTYFYPIVGGNYPDDDEHDCYTYMPIGGTIKSLYLYHTGTGIFDGAGSLTFSLFKNGVEDTSSRVVFTSATTAGNVTGLSIAFSVGDTLTLGEVTSGTISDRNAGSLFWGISYTPTNDGESFVAGSCLNAGDGTFYAGFNHTGSATLDADEVDRQCTSIGSYTLKGLRIDCGTAPGVGQTRTFTVRKNGAPTDLTVTISGANTSGTDSTHTASFTRGDLFTLQYSSSAAPAASDVYWSAVMYGVDFDVPSTAHLMYY